MRDEFKILEPEVIDNIILNRLNDIKNALGKGESGEKSGTPLSKVKWTEDEIDLRNMVIIDYIRQGLSRKRVVEEICNRWNVATKAGLKFYSEALKYLSEINKADDLEDIKNRQIERLEGVVESALDRGNYQDATRALDLVNKLNGLYTEKANITVDGEIKFEFE